MKKMIISIFVVVVILATSVTAFASAGLIKVVDYIADMYFNGYNCTLVDCDVVPYPGLLDDDGDFVTQKTTYDVLFELYGTVSFKGADLIQSGLKMGSFVWYENGGYCWIMFIPDADVTDISYVGNYSAKILYCEAPEDETQATLNDIFDEVFYGNTLLGFIYDLIDDCYKELVYLGSPLRDISSTLTTLSENLTTLSSNLTTNFDTLFGYVDSVEIILDSINSHLDDTYVVVAYIYDILITIKSQFSNDIVPDVESIRANVANLYSRVWNIAQSEYDVLDTLTTLSTDLTTNFTTLFEYLDFLGTPDDKTSSKTVYGALLKNNGLISNLGDTLFIQRLPSIEKVLDNIYTRLGEIQDAVIDAGNINIDITNDNDAFNIFYITKTDGTTESVGEAATDAAKVVGEFLSVFYRLIFSDGMANADIIHDFEEVYTVTDTGVNVW